MTLKSKATGDSGELSPVYAIPNADRGVLAALANLVSLPDIATQGNRSACSRAFTAIASHEEVAN